MLSLYPTSNPLSYCLMLIRCLLPVLSVFGHATSLLDQSYHVPTNSRECRRYDTACQVSPKFLAPAPHNWYTVRQASVNGRNLCLVEWTQTKSQVSAYRNRDGSHSADVQRGWMPWEVVWRYPLGHERFRRAFVRDLSSKHYNTQICLVILIRKIWAECRSNRYTRHWRILASISDYETIKALWLLLEPVCSAMVMWMSKVLNERYSRI